MAVANASARGQWAAILASPLHELTGFLLAVDWLAPGCNGERTVTVSSGQRKLSHSPANAIGCPS
jgi:hypothetical protein